MYALIYFFVCVLYTDAHVSIGFVQPIMTNTCILRMDIMAASTLIGGCWSSWWSHRPGYGPQRVESQHTTPHHTTPHRHKHRTQAENPAVYVTVHSPTNVTHESRDGSPMFVVYIYDRCPFTARPYLTSGEERTT